LKPNFDSVKHSPKKSDNLSFIKPLQNIDTAYNSQAIDSSPKNFHGKNPVCNSIPYEQILHAIPYQTIDKGLAAASSSDIIVHTILQGKTYLSALSGF
jgi:hypothetical protein